MFASVSPCTAFLLQYIVKNNAVNCSGSRSFPVYKDPLSHFFYIRHIFALIVSFVFSSYDYYTVTLPNYLYFQMEATFRIDRSNSMAF